MSQYFIYCRKSSESEEKQVLSIESQVKELGDLCDRLGIAPTGVLTESKSAKAPGRPIFKGMMERLYKGEVKGIICWKLDRLARNPIDGSALVWALDQGKLSEIVTPHGTFHNNSNDKFLMQIEFGMAKKYVDDLSDNVKRGNRAKLEKGWLPSRPPLGYLNQPQERTIVADPERFSLVHKMWLLLLHGVSPLEILRKATNEWGLRTRKSRRSGGSPISRSGIYALFANPFYYGLLETKAGTFQGKHEPMISETEYWRAQELLGRKGRPRPKTHQFAFTGLIRCGSCGGMITAEEKVNRYGYHYTYYHCTKRDRKNPCKEKYINVEDLEIQISDYLSKIHVPEDFLQLGLEYLAQKSMGDKEKNDAARASLNQSLESCKAKLANLNQMRIKELLDDAEYMAEKKSLIEERIRLEKAINDEPGRNRKAQDLAAELLNFGHRALESFNNGSPEEKRIIFSNIGSNLFLTGRKLIIEALKPFVILENGLRALRPENEPFEPPESGFNQGENGKYSASISQWCGSVDDVRTFFIKHLDL